MKTHDVVSVIFILILAYLLIANAPGSNTVIGALGGQSVNLITALQGRSGSGITIPNVGG